MVGPADRPVFLVDDLESIAHEAMIYVGAANHSCQFIDTTAEGPARDIAKSMGAIPQGTRISQVFEFRRPG